MSKKEKIAIRNVIFNSIVFATVLIVSYIITILIFSGSPFVKVYSAEEKIGFNRIIKNEKPLYNAYFTKPDTCNFYREDIPLNKDIQKDLYNATQEFEVDYELALAVIWKETCYRNIYGDGGNSVGYFQIQPRWVKNVMNELNVNTLEEPKSNFRVGCKLLSDFISSYGVEGGLTRYNTGSPGTSKYATEVIAKWMDLKK